MILNAVLFVKDTELKRHGAKLIHIKSGLDLIVEVKDQEGRFKNTLLLPAALI